MGDMLTLIEQAERTFDAEESAKAAAKLASKEGGDFGLDDFLQQMQMVRKMGPLSKIFGMLPGMGEIKDQINNIDEKDVDRIEAIIRSMTPAERDNPKIIDGSRRARIARGAGVEVAEVNGLVNRFFDARKMMSSLATGKMPGMPGLPGMPGSRRARRQAAEEEGRPRRLRQPGQAERAAASSRPPPTRAKPSAPASSTRRRCRRRWRSSSCLRSCAAASASRRGDGVAVRLHLRGRGAARG